MILFCRKAVENVQRLVLFCRKAVENVQRLVLEAKSDADIKKDVDLKDADNVARTVKQELSNAVNQVGECRLA